MENDSRVISERGPFEMVPHWLLYDKEVSGLCVRLYMVLRQHSDRDDLSFPSRGRLCELLNVSLPTLDKSRETLVKVGALCITQRRDRRSQWRSSLYHIHWNRNADCRIQDSLQGSKESSLLTNTHLTNTRQEQVLVRADVNEPVSEPNAVALIASPNTSRAVSSSVRQRYSADFDTFWNCYPRRAGKQAAWQAWTKALEIVDAEILITAAAKYSNDPNREAQYTAHPTTWLRQGRWDDDPLPSKQSGTGGEKRMSNYKNIFDSINNGRGIAQ